MVNGGPPAQPSASSKPSRKTCATSGQSCRHAIPFASSRSEKPMPCSVLALDLPLQQSCLMSGLTSPEPRTDDLRGGGGDGV